MQMTIPNTQLHQIRRTADENPQYSFLINLNKGVGREVNSESQRKKKNQAKTYSYKKISCLRTKTSPLLQGKQCKFTSFPTTKQQYSLGNQKSHEINQTLYRFFQNYTEK